MFACTPRLSFVAWRLLRLFLPITLVIAWLTPTLTPRPVAAAPSARIVYAKPDAQASNSGESWETARDLSTAMAEAVAGDEIWAEEGYYLPQPALSLFQLKSGVAVYGGFIGSESSRGQRDPVKHISVLSGDLDDNDIDKDAAGVINNANSIKGSNASHVVYADGTDDSAVLDGFTITGGNADGAGTNPCSSCGGGLTMVNGNATLANLIFSGNFAGTDGGGMFLNEGSNPRMTNITFIGNIANSFGGGMFNHGGSKPTLQHVIFSHNKSESDGGGMANNVNSTPIMTDVLFSHNEAGLNGGGMYNVNSDHPVLTNVTFTGNESGAVSNEGSGGGMYNTGSNPTLLNVQFIGNRTFDEGQGGGIFNTLSNPTLTNVLFSGNFTTSGTGGGISNDRSDPILTNVTLSGNVAGQGAGGGIDNFSSNLVLQNVVMWNNMPQSLFDEPEVVNSAVTASSIIRFSLIEGMDVTGSGNLDGTNPANDPHFVRDVNCGKDGCTDDPTTTGVDESANDDYGDLRLQGSSPAVDAGDNNVVAGIATDLAGKPRLVAVKKLPATVDMGAYEHTNAAPNAHTGGPYTVNEGSSLALNGSGSSDDVSIVSYAWDCTNNGSIDASATLPTGSSCTYANNGTFILRLTVTDNVSATGSATTTVTVANVPPTYTAAPAQSTFAGSANSFTLGTFSDPGAESSWPVTVNWGDNSAPTQFNATQTGALPQKTHTYAAAGQFNILVTVHDDKASDDGSFRVDVNAAQAGAPKVSAPADQSATAGVNKSFALGSFVDPDSSAPWQVSVNWGDGSTDTTFSASASGTLGSKAHSYAAADTYDVLVTVSDGTLSTNATFRIAVAAQSNIGNVAGLVFDDANGNGTQEGKEKGVAGAVITLETAQPLDTAISALVRTTTTASDGRYRLDNLAPGSYTLSMTPPSGFQTHGISEAEVTVVKGKTTTAPAFTLQVKGDHTSGATVYLPVMQKP